MKLKHKSVRSVNHSSITIGGNALVSYRPYRGAKEASFFGTRDSSNKPILMENGPIVSELLASHLFEFLPTIVRATDKLPVDRQG